MPETPDSCGESHPDRPEVTCEKPRPCFIMHLSRTHSLDWDGPQPPSKSSRKTEAARIAGGIPRETTTGPPTLDGAGQSHHDDPETSKQAALGNKGSARHRLLEAFSSAGRPLIDEEAAEVAGLPLRSEYATRCSELRRAGFIVETGGTRSGASGASRLLSQITDLGRETLRA